MSKENKNNDEIEKNLVKDMELSNDIHEELENNFAKNLFPMITEYQEKLSVCEDKLQRALADYQNLERRSQTEISQEF